MGRWTLNSFGSLFLMTILVLLSMHRVYNEALTAKIMPYNSSCFGVNVANVTNTRIYFYFACQGQDHKIDVEMYNPNNQLMQTIKNEAFADRPIDLLIPGDYLFCFNNKNSFASKVVDFDITPSKDDDWVANRGQGGYAGPSQTLTDFEKALTSLKSELRTMQTYERYFKARDNRNKATVEGTDSFIFFFSIFESLLIIGMGGLQVYVLKNYFSTSGYVRV